MKDKKNKGLKVIAFWQIFLLVSMTISISVLMSEVGSAQPIQLINAGRAGVSGSAKVAASTDFILPKGGIIIPEDITIGGNIPFLKGETITSIKSAGDKFLVSGTTLNGQNFYDMELTKEQIMELATKSGYKQAPSTWYGKLFGGQGFGTSGVTGALLAGVAWAAVAYGAVKLIGALFKLDGGLQRALEYSVTSGAFVMGTLKAMTANQVNTGLGILQAHPFWTGLGVAVAVFLLTYTKEKKKVVSFQCLPYEPPVGGAKCEECNKDPFRPCTEYRCKSLGQACELENAGTGKEMCVWKNKYDVESPKITPLTSALKPSGLRYVPDNAVRPPALGVKIISNGEGGCLPAFTPLEFGFSTNEPAMCKIDFNRSVKFDEMQYYVGGSNYLDYNHTQIMRLPGPSNISDLAPLLRNDGSMALYVRCRDANGNVNEDEYVFSFCVSAGPDTTPPIVEGTSIPSGSFVRYNADSVPIELYVNEPAECKWSIQSKAFDDMENSMNCAREPSEVNANLLYTCTGNLTGVKNQENNMFYFRCKDQPDKPENERNKMVQSYELLLKGSRPLVINSISPNETITGSTSAVRVELMVETSAGSEEGKAICSFSDSGSLDSYVTMFETNSHIHKQTLQLINGDYTYFFRCVDAGGNLATGNTTFRVFTDKNAPMVTRVYKEQALKIVTDEDAECRYSLTGCNFNTADGLRLEYPNLDTKNVHYIDWKAGTVYYIRCIDRYGNEPSPNTCSVIAKPVEMTKQSSESGK